jgi:anti-anti-sigma factor
MAAKTKPFKVTKENGALRFTAAEDLVARNIPAQRAQLLEAMQEAAGPIVLDLSRIEMVDSLGITLVVRIYKTCQEKQVPFRVEGASTEILRLFKFFSLSDLFEVKGR